MLEHLSPHINIGEGIFWFSKVFEPQKIYFSNVGDVDEFEESRRVAWDFYEGTEWTEKQLEGIRDA